MHLLFICDYYHPHLGGAENVFAHLVEGLAQREYKITILTCKHDPTLPSQEQLGPQVIIHRVGTTRKNFARHALWVGKRLCQDTSFDFIYTSTYTSLLPARILKARYRLPAIVIVHEIFDRLRYRYKKRLPAFFSRLYEQLCLQSGFDAYHCVSRYTYNSLRLSYGIPDAKLHIIYNGIDQEMRSASQIDQTRTQQLSKMYHLDNKFVLFYMGHTGASKGLDVLLDALPSLCKKYSDFVMMLNVLDSSRSSSIRSVISSLKTRFPKQILSFDGTLLKQELLHRISCADAVVMPSLSDGFGLVAGEVSCLGMPLIVSEVAALPEVASGKVIWIKSDSVASLIGGVECARAGEWRSIPQKSFDRERSLKQVDDLIQNIACKNK